MNLKECIKLHKELWAAEYTEDERILKIEKFASSMLGGGYADGRRELRGDFIAIVSMLRGGTDRKKIADYIEEYLIEK